MDVYPSRRKIWTSILGFSAFFLIGLIAAGAAITQKHGKRDWLVFVALAFIVWMLILSVRELRNPIPLARLDEDGVECALGRVPWANVAAVSVGWKRPSRYPSRRLTITLRNPAEALGPPAREYLSRSPFGGPVQADGEITMPLWDSQQRVLIDVQRFHRS